MFLFYYRQMIYYDKGEEYAIIPPKKQVYLEGPKSRSYELGFAWKVFRQFIKGFRTLHFVGPCITVFGSARFKENDFIMTRRENLENGLQKLDLLP